MLSHLRLPLVAALFALLAGLLPGLRFGGPEMLLAGAAAATMLTVALAPRWRGRALSSRAAHGGLALALTLAGAGLGARARADAAADCRLVLADGAPLEVRGALGASRLVPRDPEARTPLLPLQVESVTSRGRPVPRCAGDLRVRLPRGTGPLPAGTAVEVHGEWRQSPAPVVPSAWPRAPTYAGFVSADTVAGTAPPSLAAHPFLAMRGSLETRIHRLFPRHGALADALLLGRRETLDRAVTDRFAKAGLVHLLAISGTHVALVGAVLVLLARACRVPGRWVPGVAIALVALYLATIGAPASALRSGIMFTLALLAGVLQRPSSSLAIVAAAAGTLLALDPMAALDVGAQLSFAGVLGIIVLRGAMLRRIPLTWREGKAARWTCESLVVSLAAFLTTAPIVASHFGQVAPISIVANLPAIPLSSLVLVGIGAAVLLDPFVPPLAQLVADGAGGALDLLGATVDVAVAVPGGHAAVSPPQWWLWSAVAVVFLLAMELAGRVRTRVRWAAATLSAAAALVALPAVAAPAGGGLEIVFIDVGQGDAVALRTPAGHWVLVDAGMRDDGFDAGERRVLPYLRARGAQRLELLVLTHPHADHLGGAPAVLRALPVGRLVEPGLADGSELYLETLREARARGVPWTAARQGATFEIDGVALDLLWPRAEALDDVDDPNHISAVVRIRYGNFAALLTGDAGAEAEHELVRRFGGGLRSQLLKAGHHGSTTSTSAAFLGAVRPELVVISAGRRNRYGHPHADVLQRLAERGVQVARTDRDGTVSVVVDAGGAWRRPDD